MKQAKTQVNIRMAARARKALGKAAAKRRMSMSGLWRLWADEAMERKDRPLPIVDEPTEKQQLLVGVAQWKWAAKIAGAAGVTVGQVASGLIAAATGLKVDPARPPAERHRGATAAIVGALDGEDGRALREIARRAKVSTRYAGQVLAHLWAAGEVDRPARGIYRRVKSRRATLQGAEDHG